MLSIGMFFSFGMFAEDFSMQKASAALTQQRMLSSNPGSAPELLPENMRQVGLDKDHAFEFICI